MDYYGYTDYGYNDYNAAAGILGGIVIFGLILLLIGLAISIIQIISLWKVFKKAGKGGWESLIPFYNNYVLFEISGLNWWWFLFLFAPLLLAFVGLAWLGPLASLFATFNCYYNLAKKFNKGTGFAICLTLFSPICIPILGLSKNNVYSDVPVSNNGVFAPSGNKNTNNNMNYNTGYNYQNSNVNNDYSSQENNINNQSNINVTQQQFSFCGNCGTKLDSNIRFCPNCGKEKI